MAIDGQPSEPFLARDGVVSMAPGTRIDVLIDVTAAIGSAATIRLGAGGEPILIGKITIAGDPARPAPLPIPAPLPSNGLPEKLNLAGALRVDVPLGGPDWLMPAAMSAAAKPAFRARRGRTVVLRLTNASPAPAVFRLHGHHMRLLDKLDDGWKPFWLDTLAVGAGQTQRVAFAAEHPGAYLIESMATDRTAPRMLRSYTVE
jgi:FtsP/CotA-like multicopper oxidase with cupredoxin domain